MAPACAAVVMEPISRKPPTLVTIPSAISNSFFTCRSAQRVHVRGHVAHLIRSCSNARHGGLGIDGLWRLNPARHVLRRVGHDAGDVGAARHSGKGRTD